MAGNPAAPPERRVKKSREASPGVFNASFGAQSPQTMAALYTWIRSLSSTFGANLTETEVSLHFYKFARSPNSPRGVEAVVRVGGGEGQAFVRGYIGEAHAPGGAPAWPGWGQAHAHTHAQARARPLALFNPPGRGGEQGVATSREGDQPARRTVNPRVAPCGSTGCDAPVSDACPARCPMPCCQRRWGDSWRSDVGQAAPGWLRRS